jgi:hypothetical protein
MLGSLVVKGLSGPQVHRAALGWGRRAMMSYGIGLWLTFGLRGRDSLRTRSRAFLSRYLTRKGIDTKPI